MAIESFVDWVILGPGEAGLIYHLEDSAASEAPARPADTEGRGRR